MQLSCFKYLVESTWRNLEINQLVQIYYARKLPSVYDSSSMTILSLLVTCNNSFLLKKNLHVKYHEAYTVFLFQNLFSEMLCTQIQNWIWFWAFWPWVYFTTGIRDFGKFCKWPHNLVQRHTADTCYACIEITTFRFEMMPNTMQRHFPVLSYSAFDKTPVIRLTYFICKIVSVLGIQGKYPCKYIIIGHFLSTIVYNIHTKRRRVATFIDLFLLVSEIDAYKGCSGFIILLYFACIWIHWQVSINPC